MKKQCLIIVTVAMLVLLLTGCGSGKADDSLLMYLRFDEGNGTEASDSSGHLENTEVSYQFTHPVYTEAQDPEWRSAGIENGSLLFDGTSTFLSYKSDEICVSGPAFSVTVWAAPRAFEWDDPNAAENGTEELTAIVGQYNKDKKQGFLLGYERFGRLCFQVGTGDDWYTLWADENLARDEWNQVAAVFDGTTGRIALYLNGELAVEASIPAGSEIAAAGKERLLVGKNAHAQQIAAGTYNMFSGLMDELRLYSRVLTEEELAAREAPEIVYEDIALENILTGDPFKTQYHGGPYQHWMNEPHAPLYYNGQYHLFFQQNIVGTYWRNICWGHLVSTDMVNWRPVKEAITATENSVVPDGVWSGNATYDANGVPLLFFTAGNDSFQKDGLISNQNIGVAYPADLNDPDLIEWVIYDELAVKQEPGHGRAGEFRDPYLWKEGDVWCMLICSGSSETNGGSALLYTSDTLELLSDGSIDMNWQYRGPIYEMEAQSTIYGTSWELPILVPFSNEDGTTTKYAFFISPAPAGLADNKVYYFLGDFDLETGLFVPDEAYREAPSLLDYGDNVFTGPSLLHDPQSGEDYLFSIMQDKRSGAEEGAAGWAHCVGLARCVWLNEDGTDLCMEPAENLHTLEAEVLLNDTELTLSKANDLLEGVSGDMLYIRAVLEPQSEQTFGLRVKSDDVGEATDYLYDMTSQTISGSTTTRGGAGSPGSFGGALALEDGCLSVEIYIDRSLVEGFFNDEKAISIRSYSDPEAQRIEILADDEILVHELYIASMSSIY